jgi:DNA-directed RNA polymerase subunit H
MNEFRSFRVYTIFQIFLKHRGIKPVSQWKNKDDFVDQLTQTAYIRIEGTDSAGKKIIAFILTPDGKFCHKSPELHGLLLRVESEASPRPDEISEVFLIVEPSVYEQKNIMDTFHSHRLSARFTYTLLSYNHFMIVVPDHDLIYPHRILSKEEAADVLEKMRTAPINMPQIFQNDPPLVWIGARAGDMIEITRPSETAGFAMFYRFVKPPSYDIL